MTYSEMFNAWINHYAVATYGKVRDLGRWTLFATMFMTFAGVAMLARFPELIVTGFAADPAGYPRLTVQSVLPIVPWLVETIVSGIYAAILLFVMAFVPEFWVITVNGAPTIRFGTALEWFYVAPFSWFDSHGTMVINDAMYGSPMFDAALAILLMIPFLSFFTVSHAPSETLQLMMVFLAVSVLMLPVGAVLEILRIVPLRGRRRSR